MKCLTFLGALYIIVVHYRATTFQQYPCSLLHVDIYFRQVVFTDQF
jgi:hypothetical protein